MMLTCHRRDIHGVFLAQVLAEGVLCGVGICDALVCTVRVYHIVYPFNPSTGAITDHCQSAKNIDTRFKSQLYVEDHGLLAVEGFQPTIS